MRQLKITRQVTNRESASLEKYLHEISRLPMITADEEVKLAKRIKQGDLVALEKLTRSNLRFVVSVAKQYQNQGLSLPDLINEGNLGLIKAAHRFDETRGFKFISYAVWWIRQAIMQALAEQSRIVRLPLNKIGSLNKIKRTYSELEQEFQRIPSADEIAKVLDITEKEVKESLKSANKHLSMDAPLIQDEDVSMYDRLHINVDDMPEDELIHDSLKKEILRALSSLSKREADVLILYYGINQQEPLTLEEIGINFELTRERIRQIKERAIRKLKRNSSSVILKSYLGA
ncbi:MAG: RNA polymerase sigma factor RpoD/SigA [Bacteroidales bacterium]|nr:RNA polymerase sigma factor RpoD/SigA [Bacteroidales bacterium]